ncbi:MAG: FAD-dependent oxidoreductase [Anaerolineae bacterium]|jgi:glutamate synthase (NADPH/NADH) small chain
MSMDEVETRQIDRRARLHLPASRLDYRPVGERIRDFEEACQGFTAETARAEASRCIQCPAPRSCVLACPLHNDIPQAMWEISQGNFVQAAAIYRQTSSFPELCGRLCPDEALCAGACGVGRHTAAVQMGRLEAFVADYQRRVEGGLPLPALPPASGKGVAIVGSGPAGLTAAEELALRGHEVTLFEAQRQPGGALVYTIPRFRLPLEITEAKFSQLKRLGVKFALATQIGQDLTVDDLFREGVYALLLSTGAGREPVSDLPGMDLEGVYLTTEFLAQSNLGRSYLGVHLEPLISIRPDEKVAIFGEGHAAVDCARTAIRLGARDVTCYHRGTEAHLPCRMEDYWAAQEEGVRFVPLTEPAALVGDGNGQVVGVRCQHLRVGGRQHHSHPIAVEGAGDTIDADLVVLAPEPGPDPSWAGAVPGLKVDADGWIVADRETGQTSREGVFAAGDVTGQPYLAVMAIARGRRVAASIHDYLS